MKLCIFKEYIKGIRNSMSYLLDTPSTSLSFLGKDWFSDTKGNFEKELFDNIENAKDLDILYDFYMKIMEESGILSIKLNYHTKLFEKCVENDLFDEYELTKTAYDYIHLVFKCGDNGHWAINDFIEKHKKELKGNIKIIDENNDLSSNMTILEIEYDRILNEKSNLELEVKKLRSEMSNLKNKISSSNEFKLMIENEELKKEIETLSANKIVTTHIPQEESYLKMKWNPNKPKKVLPCLLRELRNRGYIENTNEELSKFLISYTDIFANVKESSIISNYLRGNSNDSNRNTDEIDSIIGSTLVND